MRGRCMTAAEREAARLAALRALWARHDREGREIRD